MPDFGIRVVRDEVAARKRDISAFLHYIQLPLLVHHSPVYTREFFNVSQPPPGALVNPNPHFQTGHLLFLASLGNTKLGIDNYGRYNCTGLPFDLSSDNQTTPPEFDEPDTISRGRRRNCSDTGEILFPSSL